MATMPRAATPHAYTTLLSAKCPVCTTQLVRDEFGVWCSGCLYCGTCHGKGCYVCPQQDDYKAALTPATPLRTCETCQEGPRAGKSPQCLRCLRHGIPPADVVPLVGATAAVVRDKRRKWLMAHPGWGLSPNRDYVMRMRGTKDQPFGTQLLVVEYRVERGHTSVL